MRKTNTYPPFGSLFSTVTAMVSPAHETITRQPLYDTIPPLALRPSVRSFLSGHSTKSRSGKCAARSEGPLPC